METLAAVGSLLLIAAELALIFTLVCLGMALAEINRAVRPGASIPAAWRLRGPVWLANVAAGIALACLTAFWLCVLWWK